MNEMEQVFGIVFVIFSSIVASIWILLHYMTQWKAQNKLTAQDSTNLEAIRASADRLEERLKVLERILDEDVPNWRQKT